MVEDSKGDLPQFGLQLGMEGEELTEQETALYDRQIRVWGLDAQRRLTRASILVSGVNGTTAEFCKNIVLAGVGTLTLVDDREFSEEALSANFLIPPEKSLCDGKTLAELCSDSLKDFNPMVHVSALKVIELFEEIENRRPGGISFTDLPAVLKIKKELCEAQSIDEYQVPDDLLERLVSGHGEFPPVCAILGGILGQEVIKAVSSKGEPLKNFFFFDVFNGKGVIEDVSNGNALSNFPITPNLVEHFQLID